MDSRFRQNVRFVCEEEIHLFADIHPEPGEYFGWVSSAREGDPDHSYELHLTYEYIASGHWRIQTDEGTGRTYNVTALVASGSFRVS